jgi:hypothetical protein
MFFRMMVPHTTTLQHILAHLLPSMMIANSVVGKFQRNDAIN